ncbi:MAG TPA: metallophosphoesterase [Bacteroidia bacterium]|nr:metallophosphoesterase [Bacteroidia bacterium]
MRRRSPVTFLIVPLFVFLIEGAAFYGWNHLLVNLGHHTLSGLFKVFYFTETIGLVGVLFFVMGSFARILNVKRTYYGFQGTGIIMSDLLPKLLFTVFVLLYALIQGGYVAINHFIIHSANIRLNLDWLLIFGTVASLTIFAFIVRGILVGRFDFKVLKETIHFDTLPEAFDGLRAVQISDMHIGSFYKHKDQVAKAVEMINNLKPDIIFFTGDMVNNVAEELKGFVPILAKLQAPLGKFAILGNHDYGDYVKWESKEAKIKNLETLVALEREAGFDLLLNENRLITRNGQQIAIIGVENWGTPPFAQYGQLPLAIKGTENTPFRILLSHDPSHWDVEVAEKTDIQLSLAGHTHGMQFGIRIGDWQWSPVQWRYERWHGLYTHLKQHLYVNRGLGHIGFPGRVGMLPEITVLELRK